MSATCRGIQLPRLGTSLSPPRRLSAERLRIVEASSLPSLAARRLPAVSYAWLPTARARLLNSRLHRPYSLWLTLRARHWAKRVMRLIDGFEPQAVLTVAHGHLWITAAELARRSGLPLHLIVHDDWPRVARLPAPFDGRVEDDFRRIYRAADSRLCISPFMVEEFRRRYDAEGEVLYPSRARDAPVHPPAPQHTPARGLVLAFAGTINSPDYARLLRALAAALEPRGGKLLIYGPLEAAAARAQRPGAPGHRALRPPALAELADACAAMPTSFTCRCRSPRATAPTWRSASRARSPTTPPSACRS
jgi:glycosyltransferase involved in cell wall biosynthesis